MERRKKNNNNKIHLFLDSGAFSAWTQGVEIDIHKYIDFIKEHLDILEVYSNLDVISSGNSISDKKKAAKKTLENQRIMEKEGLHPLPVFHIGEPFKYLNKYIEQYDYIALGGMVGTPKNTLIPWLDTCFSKYICDEKGIPKVKVHGFGLTSLPIMMRYPWFSVDSTSWVATSRFGAIYVPRYRNREWIYDENSWKIPVSNRSPKIKKEGDHISILSPKQREVILNYIHEKGYVLGTSRFEEVPQSHEVEENEKWAERKPKDKNRMRLLEIIEEPGLSNKYQLRDEMNIIYFQDLEKSMPEWPWPFKRKEIQGFGL